MKTATCLAVSFVILSTSACFEVHGNSPFERELTRTFQVRSESVVDVDIAGGEIRVVNAPERTMNVTLLQRVYADTERGAEQVLAGYDISISQSGETVAIRARRKAGSWPRVARSPSFNATLEVPQDVRLNLRTSGGSVDVRGERTANVDVHTSGGSVHADGGAGTLTLRTSGGSIDIRRALTSLTAETSGGNVRVDYVGRAARAIDLHTSGGNIRVGIDPAASLDVVAETSGGMVRVDDLTFENSSRQMSRITGRLNDGGGRFRAHTSGGNVMLEGEQETPAP